MMSRAVAGKFLLEILTTGMYSNPMHIYREYVQNATDSIDKAISSGILDESDAEIHICVDKKKNLISIRDNGTGLTLEEVETVLLSLGDSSKDPHESRGFRGIGRISGLGYSDKVKFITSAKGDAQKITMTCDCVRMRSLLQLGNNDTRDVIETFEAISSFAYAPEDVSKHYFEVQIENVHQASQQLLDESVVSDYLAATAPVDFDGQKFTQGREINRHFQIKGFPISCYNIYMGERKKPIYKLYTRSLCAGKTKNTKTTDFIKKVEFVYQETIDGIPLYIGWLAITDFSGKISDENIQGIRMRKGNILVGDNETFAKFFPVEGSIANKLFAGEIHFLHYNMIPNSQRDDFEHNDTYLTCNEALVKWAGGLNKKYRRGTSEASSSIRKIQNLNKQQQELQSQVDSGIITSDTKRESIAEELIKIQKSRKSEVKKIKKALENESIDSERVESIKELINITEDNEKDVIILSTHIASADYATKKDLPTSYSRDERKLYQRIIEVIDTFYGDDQETAAKLRDAIKKELQVKKK